jgi:hypothetical protein
MQMPAESPEKARNFMAHVDLDRITPQFVSESFQGLPEGTRRSLGMLGTATDWARAIRSVFVNQSQLPAGFFRLEPSAQIEFAINAHLTAGRVSLADLPRDLKDASNRLAQVLSVGAVHRSNSEMVESLIDQSTARQAAATPTGNQAQNSLQKQADVNY